MNELLKWTLIVIACCAVAYAMFALLLMHLFNIGPRTERSVIKNSKNQLLLEGVNLVELSGHYPAFARLEFQHKAAGNTAQKHLLVDERLVPGRAIIEGQGETEYRVLQSPDYAFAFKTHDFNQSPVYRVAEQQLVQPFHPWPEHIFSAVTFAAYINSNTFVMAASVDQEYTTSLYQVDINTFTLQKIADDLYFIHSRPPLIFTFADQVFMVYYTGHYSYGFGGDASRPQQSIVRVYNAHYPQGQDLMALSFASGTVLDLTFTHNQLTLHTDPSRPLVEDQDRRPRRVWQVMLPEA